VKEVNPVTELQPLKFTDSVNNIEFRLQGDTAPQEIIRLDSEGFHYRGQLIEDAGEAHRLMVEFLKQSTQSQPESAVVPVAVSDALIKAECALSDVAEGEPECDDGDPAQWAEQRCAETLAIIRPVMKLHKIRTSEWPPQPMPTPANNTSEEN
jgi:hypothetical protein